MNRQIIVSFSALAALALVAGCDQLGTGGPEAEATEAGASGEPGVLRVEQRQVDRPDIFSRQARGLWDGRISLGGRWVAIPEDIKADRVRITNQSNGTVIEGALFQRDANLPGPYFMVSMDAAQALGMTPGVPAELNVVVIRTETVEIPAPVPAPAEEPDEEAEAEEGDAASGAAAGAVAGGAISASALPDAPAPAAGAQAPSAAAGTDAGVTSPLESTVLEALGRVEAGAAPAAAAGPAPAGTGRPPAPYLQVASGSNREGAEAVARRVEAAELSATVRTAETGSGTVYRVVVGPFQTRADYDAARAALRELGYEDAFATQ
jgi:cell division septation protein DedD